MGRYRIEIIKYKFIKPNPLTEIQFWQLKSYIQKGGIDELYKLKPLWKEFIWIVYFLLFNIFIALPLAMFTPYDGIIGLSIVICIFLLINGSANSEFSRYQFLKRRKVFYFNFKLLIMNSNTYNEFLMKYKNL